MTGHVSAYKDKWIYRFSAKNGELIYKYRIKSGLQEAIRNSVVSKLLPKSPIIKNNCPEKDWEVGCEYPYYEPEALSFSNGRVHYTIVTREKVADGATGATRVIKVKRMYSISEDNLK